MTGLGASAGTSKSQAALVTRTNQFTVRCGDGRVLGDTDPDEVWRTVEEADRSVRFWDADCDCNGPHGVLVRTVTVTDWEALDV